MPGFNSTRTDTITHMHTGGTTQWFWFCLSNNKGTSLWRQNDKTTAKTDRLNENKENKLINMRKSCY